MLELGGSGFDDSDREFAKQIRQSFALDDIEATCVRFGLPSNKHALSEQIEPLYASSTDGIGSTDVGSVSWVVSTVQCRTASYAVGIPYHFWQLLAQGRAPGAHKGMTRAPEPIAGVASDLFAMPELLSAAKEAFVRFRQDATFRDPVGADAKPPLEMSV